jgi:nucleolin
VEAKTEAEAPKKRKALDEPVIPAKKTKTDGPTASSTLFVGNLSWNVDDNLLFETFKEFDGLVSARVVTERDSGRSRGFGYVDFGTHEAAAAALEAKAGAELDGRAMNLDLADIKPKNDNFQDRAADRAKRHGDTVSAESNTLFVGNLPFGIDQDAVYTFFSEVSEPQSVRLPTDK